MASAPRQPAALDAYDLLREEILGGRLLPGEPLRAAELSARYGLGLTPLREALTRLGSEGLVETAAHRSARVRGASLAELADLMRARQEIEALCLAASIEAGDAEWEGELVAAMHLLARAPLPADAEDREAAAEWEARHRRFHFALVASCPSPWLLRFWNELADHSARYRRLRLLSYRDLGADAATIESEHRAIMEAALSRNGLEAARLMRAHLGRTESAVARLLAEEGRAADKPAPATEERA